MVKYTPDFKLEVVEHYLQSSDGYVKTAKKFSIPGDSTVEVWVNQYQKWGINGLRRQAKIKYLREFKLKVIKDLITNKLSFKEIALKYNIPSKTTIMEWYNHFIEHNNLQDTRMGGSNKKVPVVNIIDYDSITSKKEAIKLLKKQAKELEYAKAELAIEKKLKALAQAKKKQQ